MLLAVICGMYYGMYQAEQQYSKLQDNYKELSDVVVCKGLRDKECIETVEKAEELLPNELEEYLLQTLGRVEVFVGNNTEFLNYMSDKPTLGLVIEGHCDQRGTEEYNRALGERRANAIRTYLEKRGVPGNRIKTLSFGEDKPAVQGSGESIWKQNRRGVPVPMIMPR